MAKNKEGLDRVVHGEGGHEEQRKPAERPQVGKQVVRIPLLGLWVPACAENNP